MSEKKKGFKQAKKMTKAEVQAQQQNAANQINQQLQAITQSLINSMSKIRHLELEMGAVANLLRTEASDGAAKIGDSVMIDYFGRLKNEDGSVGDAFDGGLGIGYVLQDLGSGKLIKDVENAIEGKKEGDIFKVDFTFPEEYNVKELAGKSAQLDLAVIKVWKKGAIDSTIADMKKEYDEKKLAEKKAEEDTKAEAEKKEEAEAPANLEVAKEPEDKEESKEDEQEKTK